MIFKNHRISKHNAARHLRYVARHCPSKYGHVSVVCRRPAAPFLRATPRDSEGNKLHYFRDTNGSIATRAATYKRTR